MSKNKKDTVIIDGNNHITDAINYISNRTSNPYNDISQQTTIPIDQDGIRHAMNVFTNNDSSYKNLHESLKKNIKDRKDELEKLEKCLKSVENLKYKPGSVVVHKQLGNGLVLCPYLKDLNELEYMGSINYDFVEKFDESLGYVVQFVKIDDISKSFKVVREIIKEEDLAPYSNASKVLFGE